ncbi:hypothetical protein E4H04_08290 [Candidatus Bathyarchaeota archaeon]|nr:MAG: hypothetical protein E4H04_08290 [Candidatus Bathyarchaeota archaeon]
MQNDTRVQLLLKHGNSLPSETLIQALNPQATNYIKENPFAFIFACVLDRGTKTEIIWTLPYYIKETTGIFSPDYFNSLSNEAIYELLSSLPKKPRYLKAAPQTIKELSKIIINEYNGKTENLWKDKSAETLQKKLQTIHGVGPGIASMTILLLENTRGVFFSDYDHSKMDIKPDAHTTRVLFRLGFITEENTTLALHAARLINPGYPGEIDAPLWDIGRKWCVASSPLCDSCPLNTDCNYYNLKNHGNNSGSNVLDKQNKGLIILDQSSDQKSMDFESSYSDELSKEALGEFYYLIASFERELRDFIKGKLGLDFEKRIARDLSYIFDTLERRKRSDIRIGVDPESDLISYAGLGDYIQIVRKYPRLFSENAEDLGDVETFFKLLASQGRNPLMHCRVLSMQMFHTSKSAIAFLRQWMKRMR